MSRTGFSCEVFFHLSAKLLLSIPAWEGYSVIKLKYLKPCDLGELLRNKKKPQHQSQFKILAWGEAVLWMMKLEIRKLNNNVRLGCQEICLQWDQRRQSPIVPREGEKLWPSPLQAPEPKQSPAPPELRGEEIADITIPELFV